MFHKTKHKVNTMMKQSTRPSTAGTKRKDPPAPSPVSEVHAPSSKEAPAKQVTPPAAQESATAASPFETREALLKEYQNANDSDGYVQIHISDGILHMIPESLEEMGFEGFEDIEDLEDDEEKKKEVYSSLTMEQVDKYHHALIARRPLFENLHKFRRELYNADPRNDADDGFVMLNTYSSWCMYPVIQKQLTKCQKAINLAMKQASLPPKNNVARDAFELTMGSILACDDVDHWRRDTESPEECDKVSKKVSKLIKELLWFTDEELGLVDPFSRKTLIHKFDHMSDHWKLEWMNHTITFKTDKNQKGMGRSLTEAAASATAPAAKKAKVATSSSSSGLTDAAVLAYINALQEKLQLRKKTRVQLKLTDDATKEVRFVVTGASDMKKLGQLCAYVTNHLSDYNYHTRKGRSLRGSYFELSLGGSDAAPVWIGEKDLTKQAQNYGVTLIVDKTVKIVQIFQGLVMSTDSGIVYDRPEIAKTVKLVWVNDKGVRYPICVEGILANKSTPDNNPLPRIVHEDNTNPRRKTGFGQWIYKTNRALRADRQGPRFILMHGDDVNIATNKSAANPLCNEDGTIESFCFASRKIDFYSVYFEKENVHTAGPPTM